MKQLDSSNKLNSLHLRSSRVASTSSPVAANLHQAPFPFNRIEQLRSLTASKDSPARKPRSAWLCPRSHWLGPIVSNTPLSNRVTCKLQRTSSLIAQELSSFIHNCIYHSQSSSTTASHKDLLERSHLSLSTRPNQLSESRPDRQDCCIPTCFRTDRC